MPKVSVIVTVYERTEFLHIALRAALDQTYQDFEIIVTDDSNSQAIRAISSSFGSDKIRYRTQPRTLGVARNLCAAVAEAEGTYISVLNDDDLWEPRFLEQLVAPLEEDSERVLAFSDHWLVDGAGAIQRSESDANSRTFGRADLPPGEVRNLADLVLIHNGVPLAMAAVFRVDAIDWSRVVDQVDGAYDYWISCLLAQSGGKAWYVAQRLTHYRVHPAMETSRRAPDKKLHLVYIHRTLLETGAFPLHGARLRDLLATALYVVGKDNLFFDQARAARGYLLRSLRVTFSARTLTFLCLSYFPARFRSRAIERLRSGISNR